MLKWMMHGSGDDDAVPDVLRDRLRLLERCRREGVDRVLPPRPTRAAGPPPARVPEALGVRIREIRQAENRFLRARDADALDALVAAVDAALADPAFPEAPVPLRVRALWTGGNARAERDRRARSPADLDEAIQLWRRALEILPGRGPQPASLRFNVGNALHERFVRAADPDDEDAAVRLFEEAIGMTPVVCPPRTRYQHELAGALLGRSRRTGDRDDADRAIQSWRAAISMARKGMGNLPFFLQSLGRAHLDLHARYGTAADADAAVVAFTELCNLARMGAPDAADLLDDLASACRAREDAATADWSTSLAMLLRNRPAKP